MADFLREKGKLKPDLIFIGAVLLVGGLLAVVLYLTKSTGSTVEVWVDSTLSATYSLADEGTYIIEGLDSGTNTLVIEDGCAWLADADCPDHTCVNMGKISRSGQSIICLPHRVVVEIVGENEADEADLAVDGVAR